MAKNIQNLKELSDLILDVGMGVEKSLADGRVSFQDTFNFKDAVFAVLPAIKGISEVDEEFFDMDDAEKVEFKAHIAAKLQLSADHASLEAIVENVLGVIIGLNGVIAGLLGARS